MSDDRVPAPAQRRHPAAPVPPALPAQGDEMYDLLMGYIDPQLCTSQLASIERQPGQAASGQAPLVADRCAHALNAYHDAAREFIAFLHQELKHFGRAACTAVEEESRAGEAETLVELEDLLSR